MTGPTSSAPLIALAVLLPVGCVLFIYGLRGRRVGNEPRCRKCGYNLTGLTSEQCPECGSAASDKNVVVGVRRRQWRALVLGLFFLLVSISWLGLVGYGRVKGINWYPYLPTFVVLHQAKMDTPAAINELVRRYNAGSIADEPLVKLIPLALRQHGLDPKPKSVWAWTDLLAALDAAGHLSQERREQFRDQIAWFAVEVRPKVRRGEDIKVTFEHEIWGGPGVSGTYTIENGVLRIGDWVQEYSYPADEPLSSRGSSSALSFGVAASRFEPGTYDVEYRATKTFDNPSFTRHIHITGEVEVLPANAPETVRLINDPALADDFRKAITISISNKPWGGNPDPGKIYIEIAIKGRIPMDAAFHMIARVGERESDLGSLIVRKTESADRKSQWSCDFKLIDAGSFVPILRTSVEAAKRTADICEIWDGELRFDAVAVPQPLQMPASDDAGDD